MPTINARKVQDVAAVIKTVRRSRQVTQQALAEHLAFSADFLSDLESGKGTMYTNRLFRTLHELGIIVTLTYRDTNADT